MPNDLTGKQDLVRQFAAVSVDGVIVFQERTPFAFDLVFRERYLNSHFCKCVGCDTFIESAHAGHPTDAEFAVGNTSDSIRNTMQGNLSSVDTVCAVSEAVHSVYPYHHLGNLSAVSTATVPFLSFFCAGLPAGARP